MDPHSGSKLKCLADGEMGKVLVDLYNALDSFGTDST